MSARFEVLLNSQRICIAGVDGIGVLTGKIESARLPNNEVRHMIQIEGLGRYLHDEEQPQFVRWPPTEIEIGDEITFRLLPAGDFDAPEPSEFEAMTSAEIDDEVFGRLEYQIDAWNGEVDFDHPPMKKASVHLVGSDDCVSDLQKTAFVELRCRYEKLWPDIAEALVKCHREIQSVEEIETRVIPHVAINMYDDSGQMELTYECDDDPESRSYFVTLRDWEVVEIVATS